MKEKKRIVIIGSSCTGKTTLAKKISTTLGIKHIELGALRTPEVT